MKKETLRVLFELLIIAIGMWFFIDGIYKFAPAPLQLVAIKMIMVSGALAHAHISGKAMFPKVNWSYPHTPAHSVRMVLYAIIPIAYAFGG